MCGVEVREDMLFIFDSAWRVEGMVASGDRGVCASKVGGAIGFKHSSYN